MSAPNNLTGKHFNRWTVIKRAGSNKKETLCGSADANAEQLQLWLDIA